MAVLSVPASSLTYKVRHAQADYISAIRKRDVQAIARGMGIVFADTWTIPMLRAHCNMMYIGFYGDGTDLDTEVIDMTIALLQTPRSIETTAMKWDGVVGFGAAGPQKYKADQVGFLTHQKALYNLRQRQAAAGGEVGASASGSHVTGPKADVPVIPETMIPSGSGSRSGLLTAHLEDVQVSAGIMVPSTSASANGFLASRLRGVRVNPGTMLPSTLALRNGSLTANFGDLSFYPENMTPLNSGTRIGSVGSIPRAITGNSSVAAILIGAGPSREVRPASLIQSGDHALSSSKSDALSANSDRSSPIADSVASTTISTARLLMARIIEESTTARECAVKHEMEMLAVLESLTIEHTPRQAHLSLKKAAFQEIFKEGFEQVVRMDRIALEGGALGELDCYMAAKAARHEACREFLGVIATMFTSVNKILGTD